MAETAYHIGPASVKDAPTLCRIVRHAYLGVARRFGLTPENCPKHPSNCSERWIEQDLTRGVMYYILHVNGQPAGCAALEVKDDVHCYLERVSILAEFRRQGYGGKMVDHLLRKARGLGLKEVGIGIIAGQLELMHWYQSIGFKKGKIKRFAHLPFEVRFMSCHVESQFPESGRS